MSTEVEKLDAQIVELQKKRQAILDEERQAKLSEAKIIIQQFGFTRADLGLTAKGARRKSTSTTKTKLEPMYRNPMDSTQTWHGSRGAKPQWVRDFLKNDGKLEDLLIKK
jgi:DNA-binding protein H-NS